MFGRFFNASYQPPVWRRIRIKDGAPKTVEARLEDIRTFYAGFKITDEMLSSDEFIRLLDDVSFLGQTLLHVINQGEFGVQKTTPGPAEADPQPAVTTPPDGKGTSTVPPGVSTLSQRQANQNPIGTANVVSPEGGTPGPGTRK